jgi:dTDP-4-amino-4,6-dideoxygalactose transaminase
MQKTFSDEPRVCIPFVDLAAQTRNLESELLLAISGVLQRGDYILGQAVERFERAFADYVGVPYAIGVASGLDALKLSLLGLGVRRDDEVIVPANSFIATALAVSDIGARPVFVDCDDTYNLDVSQLEQLITSRTRAVVPVHLTGQPARMDDVVEIARRHGLIVVEDACQAHGARYGGKPCGSLGDAGCFSFYPAKNLGALGDGGIVTTHKQALAQKLRCLRNYGQESKNHHVEPGFNSRLDTLQAAILEVKLKYLEAANARRRAHAQRYLDQLQGVGDLRFSALVPNSLHVYHLFVVESDRRDELQRWLTQCGVATGQHYPVPIYLQPAYAQFGKTVGSFPRAERLARCCLSLPMYPELTSEQIDYVTASIHRFY